MGVIARTRSPVSVRGHGDATSECVDMCDTEDPFVHVPANDEQDGYSIRSD